MDVTRVKGRQKKAPKPGFFSCIRDMSTVMCTQWRQSASKSLSFWGIGSQMFTVTSWKSCRSSRFLPSSLLLVPVTSRKSMQRYKESTKFKMRPHISVGILVNHSIRLVPSSSQFRPRFNIFSLELFHQKSVFFDLNNNNYIFYK